MNEYDLTDLRDDDGLGRCMGNMWIDELTDIKSYLTDAVGAIEKALEVSANSRSSTVNDAVEDVYDAEDAILLSIAKCINEVREITRKLRGDE